MTLEKRHIISISIWAALLVYVIFALKHCSVRNSGMLCESVNVEVRDSARLGFVTPEIVSGILSAEGIKTVGSELDGINVLEIERLLLSKPHIRRAKVYTSMDGKLNIEIEQRVPAIRIQSENGYNIYISDDGYVMPLQKNFFADVPIVTGNPPMPFAKDFSGALATLETEENISDKNYNFVGKLINFVSFLRGDSFWNAQIVQINALRNGDIELIPRAGDAVILLGDIDGYRQKLDKLLKFYRKGLAYEGWSGYKYIDIRFNEQVVCR